MASWPSALLPRGPVPGIVKAVQRRDVNDLGGYTLVPPASQRLGNGSRLPWRAFINLVPRS
jgi:hypothetical protein